MKETVTINLSLDIVVEPDDGQYHAHAPDWPGLHTSGDTVKEAIENSHNAVVALVRSYLKHDEPLPGGVTVGRQAK